MKKIIAFLMFLSCFIMANSQNPTAVIQCSPVAFNCDNVNPETEVTYHADIYNNLLDENVGWGRFIKWETEGNLIGTPTGQGTVDFKVTWANTSNSSNPKKVKLLVTWTKLSPSGFFSKSDEKPVIVRYIAPITSMNIPVGTPTNPSKGSTVTVPCSVFNISVPTPVTDPPTAVTYTWSLPSGWTGSSTTNTITVNAQTGNVGTISVQAQRADGTFIQSYSVNIERPEVSTPTITSLPTANVCYNNYTSIQTTATNVTNYTWTSTGAIDITYTYNWLYAQIKAKNTGSSGIVTLTVDNGCGSSKSVTGTIYVGPPAITSATVDGQPLSYPNYIYNPGFLTINVNNSQGSSTNWTLLNGSGNIYYAGQNQVSVYAYPFMRVEGVTSNQCGTGEARTFYVQDISNGYYRMASPNPATSIISSDILAMDALKKVTLVSAARPGIVRMYNANGSLNADTHRNNNILSFDTGNLPRGLYYLNFFFEGNRNYTEQIELN